MTELRHNTDGAGKTAEEFLFDTLSDCAAKGAVPARVAMGRSVFRYLSASLGAAGRNDAWGRSEFACWGVLVVLDWKLPADALEFEVTP